MMYRILLNCFLLITLFSLPASTCFAGIEPYENFLKGKIVKNDSLVVKDEKFENPFFKWSDIKNIAVHNEISLRILDEQQLPQSFSCEAQLRVLYFSEPGQQDPTEIQSVKLSVNYSKQQGVKYKLSDSYRFLNGYYVKIYVTDIRSKELGEDLPPVLQLSSNIVIDRQYKFIKDFPIWPSTTTGRGAPRHFYINWSTVPGAEEYDLEWCTLDKGSEFDILVAKLLAYQSEVHNSEIEPLFRNNATRITTHDNKDTISLLYNNDYLIYRIRQVQYDESGVRLEGAWSYKQSDDFYSIFELYWHEPNLNWQSSTVFAEEGKKKEVINYFDGSLRNRQTVTMNNSDRVAVVQENVYDQFGRASVSILPSPVKETTPFAPYLHYFGSLNKNPAGKPYSFKDFSADTTACELQPMPLNIISGASNYYSPANDFKAAGADNKLNYIPDASGFPMSVTQFTADNTGRIKIQGGVGPLFQPGNTSGRTTRYFYGKPSQWELDRLFGNDVGYANHYLKNTVVDPDGQVSVSYLNASGKTIATALSGPGTETHDAISGQTAKEIRTSAILNPAQFRFDASELTLSASTNYTASVTDSGTFSYNIKQLISNYPGGSFKPCSNCYYELSIKITDDCNEVVYYTQSPVAIGSALPDCNATGTASDQFTIPLIQNKEYNIMFSLALNNDVIENFTDNFILTGQQGGHLKNQAAFVMDKLKETDLTGIFSDCTTCDALLGTKDSFRANITTKIKELEVDSTVTSAADYSVWLDTLYTSLKLRCTELQLSCGGGACDEARKLMMDDVSPNGQFALFDSTGVALEPEMNILYAFWRTEFPVLAETDSLYQQHLITMDDGTTTSPYAEDFFPLNMIRYWKDEWALKFLKYHPEECKLRFCDATSTYLAWDDRMKRTEKATDIALASNKAGLTYNAADPSWLLTADTFFASGGRGASFRTEFKADLDNYTNRILNYTAAQTKGLTAFTDYMLYCAATGGMLNTSANPDNWTYCSPAADCRVPDREWQYYRDTYFELKEKYYNLARKAFCGSDCEVGVPVSYQQPSAILVSDFSITREDKNVTCGGIYRDVTISYLPGKIPRSVKLEIYHPRQASALVVNFPKDASSVTICIPAEIPAKSIKISNITETP